MNSTPKDATRSKLLLVSDDERMRCQIKAALGAACDIQVATNCDSAAELLPVQRVPVVLIAPAQPSGSSCAEELFAGVRQLLAVSPLAKVILAFSGHQDDLAPYAIAAGAHDCLSLECPPGELRLVIERAFQLAKWQEAGRPDPSPPGAAAFENMLGASPPMMKLFRSVRKAAAAEAPVLLRGETGTGKEMAAMAVHSRSQRKAGPFVVINCGAIPHTLLESELFGHEKGAFTGAHTQRKGRIEAAAGGTLFLDEIGELSPFLQMKLLRFLQERTIERVGGRDLIRVDARLISATHVDLERALRERRFRQDLYYRLAVVVLRLPALRQRDGDIRWLAEEFLRRAEIETGRAGLFFSRQALRALHEHTWPGNVRELENRVRRAAVMADRACLAPEDLDLEAATRGGRVLSLKSAREGLERELVERVLRKHAGKIAPAAAELKVSRPTFYDLMDRLGVSPPGKGAGLEFLPARQTANVHP